MNFWLLLLIFFLVSAVLCSIGFKKFVYFLSIGYGFAVAGLGIAYFVFAMIKGYYDIITIIQCILFIIYGLRLSSFLLIRELKNASYRKVLKEATKEDEKKMPFYVLVSIWISCALLYVTQTSPVFFRLYNGNVWIIGNDVELINIILPLIGCAISIIGLVLESISDRQKSKQKSVNPNMVATKGLYRIVRCPNYFGEIVFWSGVFIGGILAYENNVWEWIISILGYVLIVMVMLNGAQRLDRRQEKRYGKIKEYRNYADHTPIILPFVPIYHIGKYKIDE